MKIDFVVTWVDGSDTKWLEEKQKYSDKGDKQTGRYRDWGLFKYWFRAIEKYANWVNKIYLVTYGHIPDWLNVDNQRLVIVNHKDFIPDKYLPTFSSHPIELNMHLIPNLEEHFVYFNDDVFLNSPVKEADFFVNGLPCDKLVLTSIISSNYYDWFPHIILNNNAVINQMFSKEDLKRSILYSKDYSIKENIKNYILSRRKNITSFNFFHLSQSFLKQSFVDCWDRCYNILDLTCKRKFRSVLDVSPYLIRDFQLIQRNFQPCNFSQRGSLYMAGLENDLIELALNSDMKMICVNDSYCNDNNFLRYKEKLQYYFEKKYPKVSSFEII